MGESPERETLRTMVRESAESRREIQTMNNVEVLKDSGGRAHDPADVAGDGGEGLAVNSRPWCWPRKRGSASRVRETE